MLWIEWHRVLALDTFRSPQTQLEMSLGLVTNPWFCYHTYGWNFPRGFIWYIQIQWSHTGLNFTHWFGSFLTLTLPHPFQFPTWKSGNEHELWCDKNLNESLQQSWRRHCSVYLEKRLLTTKFRRPPHPRCDMPALKFKFDILQHVFVSADI